MPFTHNENNIIVLLCLLSSFYSFCLLWSRFERFQRPRRSRPRPSPPAASPEDANLRAPPKLPRPRPNRRLHFLAYNFKDIF